MKLVEYSTHSGYGNQMQALLNAVFIAYISNRTLVLRPMIPHDFIKIDGTRQCAVEQGKIRQQHILDLQKKIGNPYKWDKFDRMFDVPVKYTVAHSKCTKVHPVIGDLTCAFKDCETSLSAIKSITDKVLCLGALNDYHTNLLYNCSLKYTIAKKLWDNGLRPKNERKIRDCTCEYVRLSDSMNTPGKITFGECHFDCVNDVWKDQVCCASCRNIFSNTNKSSFWQQIERLHRQYKSLQ